MAPSKFIEERLNNNEENKPFPYKITRIPSDINEELLKDFTGERSYFVQVGPKKYFFPSNYEYDAEKYYNFEVRKDDIWVVTFPRSGTTWTLEMVWLIANNLDYKTAAEVCLNERCPFLEFSTFVHSEVKKEFLDECKCPIKLKMIEEATRKEWQVLPLRDGRRIIKTHLPFSLLPQNLLTSGCKVLYVARNPKDVITSYYHLNKLFKTQGYNGNLKTYWSYFKRNLQPWTPYWDHLQEGWDRRSEKNLLFMFYENMNKVDGRSAIRNVATFLEKDLAPDQIDSLNEHLKIENFRKNPSVNCEILMELGITKKMENGFVRKGKTGGWKDELTDELNKEINEWLEENLRKTNIKFPYNCL